jgi:periplasmic protein TonB
MFETLIESRPAPSGLSRWGLVCAVGVHAAVLSAALRAPAPPPAEPEPIILGEYRTEPTVGEHSRELVAPRPAPPTIDAHLLPAPPPEPIPGLPELTATFRVDPGARIALSSVPGASADTGPMSVSLVQERPELLAGPPPLYPRVLREAGVEGLVVIQVVLDTLGRPEPGSARIVQHAAIQFEVSAAAAILASRFRPARVWGRAVRVLVQLPVEFRLAAGR